MDIVKIRRINDASFYFKEMVNGYLFCMCHNNCHFIICGGWSFIGEVWSYISQKHPLWRVLEQKRLRWIVMLLPLSSTCCAPGLLELRVMEVNWTSGHLWRPVQRYVYCYKTREWPFMFKVCTHTLACKRAMHWLPTEWLLILKENRLTKVWLFKNHRKRLILIQNLCLSDTEPKAGSSDLVPTVLMTEKRLMEKTADLQNERKIKFQRAWWMKFLLLKR